MQRIAKVLSSIDDGIYKAEKALVVAFLAMMSFLVFLDVFWRIIASPDSKIGMIIIFILERIFTLDLEEGTRSFINDVFGPYLGIFLLWFLVFMGVTGRMKKERPLGSRLIWSVVVTGSIIIFALAVTWIFSEGFPYSQRVALSMMLWVGFLGGSMATKMSRHIQIEVATKFMKGNVKKWVTFVSRLAAAVFCIFIIILGARYCWANFVEWRTTQAARFEIIPIPYWSVTLSIPVSFFMMACRFVCYAVRDVFKKEESKDKDADKS